jgi:cbb3-type cytochrome c oxidase subunit III
MRHARLARTLVQTFGTVAISGALTLALAAAPQEHQHEAGAHRHPDAAKVKNPVPADATSIAAGKAIYDKNCANCHGETGKGDGKMGEELNPKPSNLTDAEWKHGSTDGEIYKVIHEGSAKTGMKAYGRKLTDHQIWDVINYIRSIGPKAATR